MIVQRPKHPGNLPGGREDPIRVVGRIQFPATLRVLLLDGAKLISAIGLLTPPLHGRRLPPQLRLRHPVERGGPDHVAGRQCFDMLATLQRADLQPGFLSIPHPYKRYSAQAAAFRLNIPFTAHPMFGHDIIYTHPANDGAAIGRTALRDFLTYAEQVSQLEGGVYLSVGSAVMSPMIFEKSFSMSQNVELQQGHKITKHHIVVVDLAESTWDWQKDGEPPANSPAYYLRFCKSFSRMGGTMRYVSADNRDFC